MNNYANNLTTKERREYFWYLLLLFLVSTVLLTWLLLYKSTNPFHILSQEEKAILKQRTVFENKQQKALALYDTTMQNIKDYKTSHSNILEAEIKNDIRMINGFYDKDANADARNICFQKMATFLEMHFTDIISLQKSVSNNKLFQKQLDDCRMGLDKDIPQIRAANPTGH